MIGTDARAALEALPGVDLEFDADTSRLTSLRVGGPADVLATPTDRAALAALLATCARLELPQRVIGRGFNTLVHDAGIDGVLLRLSRFRRLERVAAERLSIEAGVTHSTLTRFCREHALSGLEFGSGIPGSVGGWIVMNAGIPGREARDVVEDVEVMTADGAETHRISATDLRFRYRGADGLPHGSVVIAAHLQVKEASREAVSAEIERVQEHRARTQPLDVPTCGSVFRNPDGAHAGALIEQAGLKGHRIGGAVVSPTHANFIENHGGACTADVLALIELAREKVAAQTGIDLETEVHVIGRPS